jgi:hypothetical protein
MKGDYWPHVSIDASEEALALKSVAPIYKCHKHGNCGISFSRESVPIYAVTVVARRDYELSEVFQSGKVFGTADITPFAGNREQPQEFATLYELRNCAGQLEFAARRTGRPLQFRK